MMQRKTLARIAVLMLAVIVVFAGCTSSDSGTTTSGVPVTTATTAAPPPTTTSTVPPPPPPPPEPAVTIPFLALWEGSGHADETAEAFVHWDEDDPQVVPASCAKCHSEPGYLDYLGVDGSAVDVVDSDHPIGTTVTCVACHNDATLTLDSVTMPSGAVLTGLGREARCMNCHQGRESTVSVNAAIDESGLGDDDTGEDLGFLNIHYYAAAATKYGTEAKGGYEYEGNTYDAFFVHVEGYEACQQCHDPHSLELKLDECSVCHSSDVLEGGGVAPVAISSAEDLKNIRMPGSLVDFDGDGDLTEGVYFEIEGLRNLLYAAILSYSADVIATPVVYDAAAYPYFFLDTNADGTADPDEANFGNRFNAWTPRLLKAAYNYQVSLKDPGAFAHGGKYLIQLMTDSIESLNEVLPTPIDMAGTHRIDHGHFAGSEEAFRHWDEDDPAVVPGSCSKCHSAEGLPLFLEEGVTISQEPSNGFLCSTCHSDVETFTLYESPTVEFPSGAVISLETDITDANMQLCINCHQGRSSTASVEGLIDGLPADTVSDQLRFINIHYFAAGATIFGTQVQGGYEYPGNTYVGRFEHVPAFQTCTTCHDTHALEVEVEACGACHAGVSVKEDLETIRIAPEDWDGDGDTTEGVYGEVETMKELLLAEIQAYAAATDGAAAIIYSSAAYPYFFLDTDENGQVDPGEAVFPNQYNTWTPRLLQASYNYQYASKDPGGYAHNGAYILQLLYDGIAGLGGDVSGLTRP